MIIAILAPANVECLVCIFVRNQTTLSALLQQPHGFFVLCIFCVISGEMSKGRRSTRSQKVTNLSKFLGGPMEMIPSEVPTLRDVLRYVIFLQRFQSGKLIFDLVNNAADRVIEAWTRSNIMFSPPVVITKKAIMGRIQRAYNFFCSYTNTKQKKRVSTNFQGTCVQVCIDDLDKLFDITKCRCTLIACTFDSAHCKPGCQVSSHENSKIYSIKINMLKLFQFMIL